MHQGKRIRRDVSLAGGHLQCAEQVTRFLVEAFDLADPHHARGEKVTAREILDRSAERVARSMAGEPALQSALMDTIGRVYANLGVHRPARALLEDALALRRRVHGEASPEVAETLTHLGLLHHDEGDDRAAEQAFRRALEIRRAAREPDHERVAERRPSLEALFGGDAYPYGIEPNRAVLEAVLDYAAEQGLVARRPELRDLFAPESWEHPGG